MSAQQAKHGTTYVFLSKFSKYLESTKISFISEYSKCIKLLEGNSFMEKFINIYVHYI